MREKQRKGSGSDNRFDKTDHINADVKGSQGQRQKMVETRKRERGDVKSW